MGVREGMATLLWGEEKMAAFEFRTPQGLMLLLLCF